MAIRPVFISDNDSYVDILDTEFSYFQGFAKVQRQRNVASLHAAFLRRHPDKKILEISSFSDQEAGIALSAFNLMITLQDGKKVSVEKAYQAGKVFENGGPYRDLLEASSMNAKKDPRLKESGRIVSFVFEDRTFSTYPDSLFYSWLYLKGLSENQETASQLLSYDAFTDIVFNPKKSVSCQAFVCALYVSLQEKGELERALTDTAFLASVLKETPSFTESGLSGNTVPARSQAGASARKATVSVSAPKEKAPFHSVFKISDKIEHPKFGTGTIKEVVVKETSARLTVWFEALGEEKKLSESWVRENCKIHAAE